MKASAESDMIAAVERSGLQVPEFNQIVERMASDTEVRSRVAAKLQERSGSKPTQPKRYRRLTPRARKHSRKSLTGRRPTRVGRRHSFGRTGIRAVAPGSARRRGRSRRRNDDRRASLPRAALRWLHPGTTIRRLSRCRRTSRGRPTSAAAPARSAAHRRRSVTANWRDGTRTQRARRARASPRGARVRASAPAAD